MSKEKQPNWNSFTKAELIKTIKTLHTRQTKLLNEIAALKLDKAALMGPPKTPRTRKPLRTEPAILDNGVLKFPWEQAT